MQQTSEFHQIRQLDDPAFLAERARVRELLEHTPEDAVDRAALTRLYQALTDEFTRRATAAWESSNGGQVRLRSAGPAAGEHQEADDSTRRQLLAIEVLLEDPEEISDGLEAELYALRDRLQAGVPSRAGRTRVECGSRRSPDPLRAQENRGVMAS